MHKHTPLHTHTLPGKQRGAALLIALAITVLAAVLAISAIETGQLDMRKSSILIRSGQAQQLAMGMEDWAISLIQRDQNNSSGAAYDGLEDIWYQQLPLTQVSGGTISGTLIDLDGRFNLNSLLEVDGAVNPLALERFRRLLVVLQLNPSIADQLLDWLDADTSPQPQGAEDNIYRNRQPPGLAANQLLSHISELRILPAMDAANWQRLKNHVSANPQRSGGININTATAEVLLSLADGITRQMINSVIRQRGGGFRSLSAFLQLQVFENINIDPRGLTIRSYNYRALAEIQMDGEISQFETLLQRSGSVYHVLHRRRIIQ
ncbi:hypothetical protein MNBD_GAMMA26-1244 [hydrothermal vent metagenome]|uniref:General secretion pathway protein K n=1 Tax=hydrothermal vent metagenome TaxID=652676 RepID=A0A3B1B491_9ZZZZ